MKPSHTHKVVDYIPAATQEGKRSPGEADNHMEGTRKCREYLDELDRKAPWMQRPEASRHPSTSLRCIGGSLDGNWYTASGVSFPDTDGTRYNQWSARISTGGKGQVASVWAHESLDKDAIAVELRKFIELPPEFRSGRGGG